MVRRPFFSRGRCKRKDLRAGRPKQHVNIKFFSILGTIIYLKMAIIKKYVFLHLVLCQFCQAIFLQGGAGRGKDGVLQGGAAYFSIPSLTEIMKYKPGDFGRPS